ncbi:M15 family metallopeptidase [Cellulophaga fucicola]|uniref:D-alanyl-D-alanine carboxypeptidase n=1 Tax=Cellulophaga fucicola TaxID=76595 RepID=A0A1K1R9A8_9FLAO|nr:M15 family metallopeptidase [Cellulophaga fucicola]SFW68403.1 D-alanyl-D-alanine carboxypeptidase [Cellulophaga fucicola]
MQRRSFILKSGIIGAAALTAPHLIFAQDEETEYSVYELMGQADIELYGKDINLRKEAYEAFKKMKVAAYSAGIDLKIVSSYRNFRRQEGIWERKYIKYTDNQNLKPLDAIEKIIEYSTIPGTSRHHWGTDIDIIDGYQKTNGDVLVPSKFEEGGPFKELKKWMDENANDFGFHLVYTNDKKRRGFKYEPWHYSYAPISKPMLEQFRGKNIMRLIQEQELLGSEHFTAGFLRSYIVNNILDINPDLL